MAAAAATLARGLPEPLQPLARIAYDLRWSWAPGGPDLFASIDPVRWQRLRGNAVRFLSETDPRRLERAAADGALTERIAGLATLLAAERRRPPRPGVATDDRPVAFMCAEFGLHPSVPIYSGGLGVLAGDILKSASDLGVPMVGVGLLYRNGYFHQRLDTSGLQHEFWVDTEPGRTPCVLVTGDDGRPLTVTVPIGGEDLLAQVWRLDVGRVPLYLLDTDLDANSTVGRWVTARLYESNRHIRLAQYAVLGLGGARALTRLGVEPCVYHLNEGHPSLASVELVSRERSAGAAPDVAWERARRQLVFTTHTPVPAGNETYAAADLLDVLGPIADLAGDRDRFVAMGRTDPADPSQHPGLTPFALRVSRSANGVSRRHGEVARAMWQPLFGSPRAADTPITHVTNGVHVATWLGAPMRELLDAHLGAGWMDRAHEPSTWEPVDAIADADIWAARNAARAQFVTWLRQRSTNDRLRRGEDTGYARAAERGFATDRLTVGFARRLAAYKRLHLLSLRPERSLALLAGDHPIQFALAGKAHPADDAAKRIVQDLFRLKGEEGVGDRVAFIEDYDLTVAPGLVAGCDVWINVPRPPEEASGTSGMKAALNGGLNLSVLDGWWAEAYDGTNGWAIDGTTATDTAAQDQRHADDVFDLLEQQVVPLFHDRDASGVPTGWVAMIKANLRTNGPRFSAARMVAEYADRIYPDAGAG